MPVIPAGAFLQPFNDSSMDTEYSKEVAQLSDPTCLRIPCRLHGAGPHSQLAG